MSKETAKLKLGLWVRCTWDDAVGSDEGWIEAREHTTEVAACITVGKVVKKDRRQVTLAQSAGVGDDQIGNLWSLPLGMITKVELFP